MPEESSDRSDRTDGTAEEVGGNGEGGEPNSGERLTRLRQIIVGPERLELLRLLERLDDPQRQAEDVSRVLPAAMALRSRQDNALANTLAPIAETALKSAVRRDPRPLADAIFPVMGPAIRKAITSALAELVQSLNQALEHTFSLRGLKWRWEALRTGKSFGEVVLRHSLVFRVEQLFLIHRESGLLLQHVVAGAAQSQAPEMVAGMLTAIQDFVRDSFKIDSGEALETMQVGELTVWVEQGPQAILAAVIRGMAPLAMRQRLQVALERIHAEHFDDLGSYEGDRSVFDRSRPELAACLAAELRERSAGSRRWRTWVLVAVLGLVLAFWGFSRLAEQRRWQSYLSRLRQEPGLVITETGRSGGQYFVAGLRDPGARDPVALLDSLGLSSSNIRSTWQPYLALQPAFVLARAQAVLDPPQSAQLELTDGALVVSGSATHEWISRLTTVGPALPGIARLRLDRLTDKGPAALQGAVAELEQRQFYFDLGSDAVKPEEETNIPIVAGQIRDLDRSARAQGFSVTVYLRGYTDDLGPPSVNARLGPARAVRVRTELRAAGTGNAALMASGEETGTPGRDDAERARNRRVSLVVSLSPGSTRP